MKNKQEIQKEIDALKKQQLEQDEKIKLLQEQLNKPEKWQDSLVQPSKERFWYLTSHVELGFDTYEANKNHYKKPEHAFKTQEQAELLKEKMLLMQEMYAFAHVKNEGKLPDWNIENRKYGISIDKNNAIILYYHTSNIFVFGVTFNNKKDAEEALQIFGERIQKYYNKTY